MPTSRIWLVLVLAAMFGRPGGFATIGQSTPPAGLASELSPAAQEASYRARLAAAAQAEIALKEHNIFHRPIELSDGFTHWIDRSYAYGSTQLGLRPVHLGVEFVNARGTSVYAVKAGQVVFAGDDSATRIGPRLDYYGNLVILAHDVVSLAGRQVFTLYGHLDEIAVEAGQAVDDLDMLGQVGDTGIAIGPHLHFETRVEDPYNYRLTRNPELWLQHYVNRGMIIGAVRDAAGRHIQGKRISIRGDEFSRDVFTYGGDIVNPDPLWEENFSIGDLPEGEYEIVVLTDRGTIAFAETLEVQAYKTTYVEITAD